MRSRAPWLIAVIAVMGLASCGDRTPGRPLVAFGPWSGAYPAPAPPVPATASGPADSLLEANRALWTSSGVDSYRYRFRWECFCGTDYVRIVDIVVINGAIVSVVDASTGRAVSAEAAARYRTIDGLFGFLREAIDRPADSVRAVYDANLGFPVEGYVDYVAQIADEEMGFRIYGLSPLNPQ